MNELNVIESNGQLLVDSREVAEMVDKQHAHLLRDIKGYGDILTQSNFGFSDFFIQSNYEDSTGRTLPCYLLTRKGCDLVANKMTGEKGVLFTATYVTKFEEMEKKQYVVAPVYIDSKMMFQIAQALSDKEKQVEVLSLENKQKMQIIGELKPKADYLDSILKNKGLVTITQIAKDYGMTGQAMNDILHTLGVQYKQSHQWLLYKEHQACGYTHSETIDITRSDGRPDVKMNTKWTQKGRLFLYDLLKLQGTLPVIETKSA